MATVHSVGQGPLEVRIKREGRSSEVQARGEIDLATTRAFETSLRDALEGDPAALVVDLREVNFIDPSGARALLWATARAGEIGQSLRILCTHSARRMIELTGLADALPLVVAEPGSPPHDVYVDPRFAVGRERASDIFGQHEETP